MAFTQIPVVGTWQLADDTPLEGTCTFTPTATMRNGETVVDAPVVASIVGGNLAASLAATDDDGTTPQGVTYKVEVRSHRHAGVLHTAWIEVPHDGGTVDLDDAPLLHSPPDASQYLTRAVADGLYAPLVQETEVAYTPSFTPDTGTGLHLAMPCTGPVTVQPPTGPTGNRLMLSFAAVGAERAITFASGVRASSGVDRGPHLVPAGEALIVGLQHSDLLAAWVLVAATVTET